MKTFSRRFLYRHLRLHSHAGRMKTVSVKKLLLFSVAVLLAGGAGAVRGQSALDAFNPHANGQVDVIVVQPDGKILVGGQFTPLSANGGAAFTRNCIYRMKADGTLVSSLNPNANNYVYSNALQADGK